MKTKIVKSDPKIFQPISIEITFETARELGIALAIFNNTEGLAQYLNENERDQGFFDSTSVGSKEVELIEYRVWQDLNDIFLESTG